MQDPIDRPAGSPTLTPQSSMSGGSPTTAAVADQAKAVAGQAADKASSLGTGEG